MKTKDTEIARPVADAQDTNSNQSENRQATADDTSTDTSYNSDITDEDLKVIGQDFQNNIRKDGGDDVQLTNRSKDVDFTGNELDVPGRSQLNRSEETGLRDEENRLHSQGSADNESLEEQSDQYTA